MKTGLRILSVLSALAFTVPAFADPVLFVSPTRINLDEKHKVEVVNISNLSDVARSYKVTLENLTMTEEGVTKPVDTFPYSAKKLVRFFPREFTVQPGQAQVIRVMAKIPADLPDGEFHVHIDFFEDATDLGKKMDQAAQNGTTISAPVAYSTMLPVTIGKGKIDTKVDWTAPKLTAGAKPGIYHFATELLRSGNGQGHAYVDMIYVGDGKETQISNRRTVYIYRELDKMKLEYDFMMPDGKPHSGKIKIRLLSGDPNNPALVKEALLAIP